MPATHRRLRLFADGPRRFIAAGSAALVFALTVFAASPVLHGWLHKSHAVAGNDDCAVVLFASGVSLPLDLPTIAPPSATWVEQPRVVTAEIFLASPRYLRQPERGPPVS